MTEAKAPERIWAGPSFDDKGTSWDVGHWDAEKDDRCVPYIPEALSDAKVAAAYEKAVRCVADHPGISPPAAWSEDEVQWFETGVLDMQIALLSAIRALVPADAQAALDARDERIRREERERFGPVGLLLLQAMPEAERAMQKYPQPNYVISKWAEETGEVTKAAIHYAEGRETIENMCGEIVQSLAMLHRLIVEGDELHGAKPFAAAIMEGKE